MSQGISLGSNWKFAHEHLETSGLRYLTCTSLTGWKYSEERAPSCDFVLLLERHFEIGGNIREGSFCMLFTLTYLSHKAKCLSVVFL